MIHERGDIFIRRTYLGVEHGFTNPEHSWQIFTLSMWNPRMDPDVGTASHLVNIETGKPWTTHPWYEKKLIFRLTHFDLYQVMAGGVGFNPTAVYKIFKFNKDEQLLRDLDYVKQKANDFKEGDNLLIPISFLEIHEGLMEHSGRRPGGYPDYMNERNFK